MKNTNFETFVSNFVNPSHNVEGLKSLYIEYTSANEKAFDKGFDFACKLQKLHEFLLKPETKQVAKNTYNYEYIVSDVLLNIFGIKKSMQAIYIQVAKNEGKLSDYKAKVYKVASDKNLTPFFGLKDFLSFTEGKKTKNEAPKKTNEAKPKNEAETKPKDETEIINKNLSLVEDFIKSASLETLKLIEKQIKAKIQALTPKTNKAK